MSVAGVQFKIMPESLDINLDELKTKIEETIQTFEAGVLNEAKEEPIAFGLKALIITMALSESEETDAVEKALSEIQGVSSIELIDYRRAVG